MADLNAYDEVPYSSYPFSQSDPAKIHSTAYIFGLDAPIPATAKVLELGCSSGNNILAFAARFPQSQCIGVDFSEKQIAEGKERIKALGIKNLKLEHKSILDIDKKFGKFDYIICHGVFSWVPKNVQEKILEVCSNNLSENGVAYISYNTMPGWAAVQSLREMMLYHTARFTDPKQKAEQARLLLKFILDSLDENNKSYYYDIVKSEMEILKNQHDWYLLHDHLEENNTQYYFHQFMEMAQKEKLQYLSETTLSSVFSGNLRPETAQVLSTSNDIVRTEQYMDFISNRRFRSTLLCHSDRKLRRNLDAAIVHDKFVTSNFRLPENYSSYKLGSGENLAFIAGPLTLTSADPIVITAFGILAEQQNKPIALRELVKLISAKIKDLPQKPDDDSILTIVSTYFLRYIFMGGIVLHMNEGQFTNKVSSKPEAFPLARYQAENQPWATNLNHEMSPLNPFDKAILPLLDGKNDEKALIQKLLPKFKNDELTMNVDGVKLTDEKVIEEKLAQNIKSILQRYAAMSLLVK